jgi:concanavalin A-like lectin/glucanase superfamily protein
MNDSCNMLVLAKKVAGSWPRRALSVVAATTLAGSALLAGSAPGAAAAVVNQVDVTAPAAPDVSLLGDTPRGGELATLRFTSTDADTGLDGFWYGINEEIKREFVAAPALAGVPGVADVTFIVPPVGGRIFVFVWAEDGAGNSSNRTVFDFFAQPADRPVPEAIRIASWPLDGDAVDVVGANNLTLAGVVGDDYSWVEDGACGPESALDLHGTASGYAATIAPVISTSASFSIAALVGPGTTARGDQTVLSQAGASHPAMLLQQTAEESWRFAVPSLSPVRQESGVAETAPGTVQHNTWNHLAGVVDLGEEEIRLYVNGELAATGELPASRWPARGSFYLGAAGTTQSVESPFTGTVDSVGVWSGRLLASQIRNLAFFGGGGFPPDC